MVGRVASTVVGGLVVFLLTHNFLDLNRWKSVLLALAGALVVTLLFHLWERTSDSEKKAAPTAGPSVGSNNVVGGSLKISKTNVLGMATASVGSNSRVKGDAEIEETTVGSEKST